MLHPFSFFFLFSTLTLFPPSSEGFSERRLSGSLNPVELFRGGWLCFIFFLHFFYMDRYIYFFFPHCFTCFVQKVPPFLRVRDDSTWKLSSFLGLWQPHELLLPGFFFCRLEANVSCSFATIMIASISWVFVSVCFNQL